MHLFEEVFGAEFAHESSSGFCAYRYFVAPPLVAVLPWPPKFWRAVLPHSYDTYGRGPSLRSPTAGGATT